MSFMVQNSEGSLRQLQLALQGDAFFGNTPFGDTTHA